MLIFTLLGMNVIEFKRTCKHTKQLLYYFACYRIFRTPSLHGGRKGYSVLIVVVKSIRVCFDDCTVYVCCLCKWIWYIFIFSFLFFRFGVTTECLRYFSLFSSWKVICKNLLKMNITPIWWYASSLYQERKIVKEKNHS